ncbi:MAG: heat-inducible transcription repressor HrcA [bacterium]|nr:heat-inducible transcription repressor HrcA [bacterium]MCP4800881.1 heat-inducible transcription repressor HrcA [bacterium]
MTDLHDRKKAILHAVVRLYSDTGVAVSSTLVAKYMGKTVSSATVRASMKSLEDQGMLCKLHTSAGRIPTDAGFRAFVNQFVSSDALPQLVGSRVIDLELSCAVQNQAVAKSLAALLCKLTDGVGIILGPTWDGVRAIRLDLHYREGNRILMVLVLENALIRTAILPRLDSYSPEVLDEAARILSERINGLTINEIRNGALAAIDPDISSGSSCASELASVSDELFTDFEYGDIELSGFSDLLEEPELANPESLKDLVRFLESPASIRDAVRRLSPGATEDGVSVWIGDENPVQELKQFSIVSAPYELGGRRGALAVLGVKRMQYHKIINGMRLLVRSLERLN